MPLAFICTFDKWQNSKELNHMICVFSSLYQYYAINLDVIVTGTRLLFGTRRLLETRWLLENRHLLGTIFYWKFYSILVSCCLQDVVEKKLSQMILDKKFSGKH